MTVRNAKLEDMALAAEIMVTSFRTSFASFVSPETMDACANPENCRAMLEHISHEGKMHFLLGGDQGFLCWQDAEDGAEIVALHSVPASWGTGLGHAMITEALDRIGDRPVYLWAFKDNTRARRFYEKHGFRWDGSERISQFDGELEVRYVRIPGMIREARNEDLPQILELYLHLHETDVPEMAENLRKAWTQIMEDENHHLIVCEMDGKIVSSCVCVIIPNLTRGVRPYAFVENVVTHAAYRGKGYASACLDYARGLALREDCYKMMLLTGSKSSKTLAFYQNAGYNSTDKTAFIQWL